MTSENIFQIVNCHRPYVLIKYMSVFCCTLLIFNCFGEFYLYQSFSFLNIFGSSHKVNFCNSQLLPFSWKSISVVCYHASKYVFDGSHVSWVNNKLYGLHCSIWWKILFTSFENAACLSTLSHMMFFAYRKYPNLVRTQVEIICDPNYLVCTLFER